MSELWFKLEKIPDLTLNKYSSLEENGVDGVIEKHIAFLRQLNRKGIVAGLSFHLFYLYTGPEDALHDNPGNRLSIFLLVKGNPESLGNIPAFLSASPLADFFVLQPADLQTLPGGSPNRGTVPAPDPQRSGPAYKYCACLTKTETLLPARIGEEEDYYIIRDWEMNEDGRLYNMCKMMEAMNHSALYRVDLYPTEKSISLREALRNPMNILRKRQEDRGNNARRDYDGKDVLDNYEDLIDKYDTSPHFIANIFVFSNSREDAVSILDAAGSESLIKGKYNIATFSDSFSLCSFLDDSAAELENLRERMILKRGKPGLIICKKSTMNLVLNYLPTLFSLEEIAPFFRLPALYDGEVIQIPKETAPPAVEKKGSLFLGKDKNGYDVFFPLSLLPKHAFVAGVPGSGKTNTMHHITSSLWKEHRIPFLVLEPAKQEYRALANDPDMKEMYLFSPNADMSFPLHINPFEMPKGILVAEHIRRLCSVFEGAFPLDPPMPFLLDTAIEAVYRELGWIPEHVYTGEEMREDGSGRKQLPTMSMLYKRLEAELQSTEYSDEVRGNLESALKVRIGSLLRREMGDVFDVPESTFQPEKWLKVPAVIELESMGSGPANFLTLLLCSLIRETLKVNPKYDGSVRHIIFIEEAHNLIGPEAEEQSGNEADPKQAATSFIVKMLAEVRALKEGIVIADQLPSVMAQEVLKNTGLKIGLRITSSDDRALLGSTMAASGLQMEQMSTFAVGEALIFYEKLQRPFVMRIKEWCGEIKDKQEKAERTSSKNDSDLRESIREWDTYQEINLKSMDIIEKKYVSLYNRIRPVINNYENWLKQACGLVKKIGETVQLLQRAELGEIQLNEDLKRKKYDQLELLQSNQEALLSNQAREKEIIRLMETLWNWISTLERLKNGRWKRFGAPEEKEIRITFIQAEMCGKVISLYRDSVFALGVTERIKNAGGIVRSVQSTLSDLDNQMGLYMKKHHIQEKKGE